MINQIYHYQQLTDLLLSSGMPTPEQIASFSENGIKTVINLATSKSEGAMLNEKELVESQNITYYNIPVDWANPTAKDLAEFMSLMDKHKDSKMLVHCQANYRATAFITLYRILRLNWEKEKAFAEMNKMWNPEDFPVWQEFIDKSLGANEK